MKLLITSLLLSTASIADVVTPEITSGRYYFTKGGEQVEGYKLKLHTAIAEAVRLADECSCVVTIKTPDIKVKIKREPRTETATQGNATVSWTAPDKRENGQSLALNEIQKYVISYTHESGGDMSVDVIDSGATEYTINNLDAGVWSFRMAAVDTGGLSSDWSDIVQKQIN